MCSPARKVVGYDHPRYFLAGFYYFSGASCTKICGVGWLVCLLGDFNWRNCIGKIMNWIREHIHTIALLLVVLVGIFAGIVVGGMLAFISGFWLVVSGEMAGMVITSWGY
jgi:hypothetical protein